MVKTSSVPGADLGGNVQAVDVVLRFPARLDAHAVHDPDVQGCPTGRSSQSSRIAAIENEIARLNTRIRLINEECRKASPWGYDPLDRANGLLDRSQKLTALRTLEKGLQQATRARERVELGHGGICEGCGESIELARLEVHPQATRCVACQTAWDRGA